MKKNSPLPLLANYPLRSAILLLILMFFPTLACSLPTLPQLPFLPGPATETPVGLPTTPSGEAISYQVPLFGTRLQPGETIPGTQLTYIGRADDAYEVSINGEQAMKQTGDSFFWSGVLAPGVFANYNLRLTASILGGLPVAGPIDLIVLFPEPLQIDSVEGLDAQYHFPNILLDWHVPLGTPVPGTTLTFDGLEEQGVGDEKTKMARIGGLSGHPLIAVGDSLSWTGRLRDNVSIRYSLRALSLDEESIHLFGTGELWITN